MESNITKVCPAGLKDVVLRREELQGHVTKGKKWNVFFNNVQYELQ